IDVDVGDDAVLQSGADDGGGALIADSTGLFRVDLDSARVSQVASASGTPARPTVVDGVAYAAWLTSDTGTLWSSDRSDDPIVLRTDQKVLAAAESLHPVFRTSGTAAVLEETATGSLWTVPDGEAIPLAQWTAHERTKQDV